MKTKEIEELLTDWIREWGRLTSTGPTSTEYLAKQIKQYFQRRKPKCVWTKGQEVFTVIHNGVKYPFVTLWKYCPYCGGKIEVKELTSKTEYGKFEIGRLGSGYGAGDVSLRSPGGGKGTAGKGAAGTGGRFEVKK